MRKVVVIEGDGIGREVIPVAVSVIEATTDIEIIRAEMGLECYRTTGTYLPQETLQRLEEADACLFGAITSPLNAQDYQSPLLFLRRYFDLFVNLRPVKRLHPEIGMADLDLVLFRENTEGMYTGLERRIDGGAVLERMVTERACNRLVRFAKRWAEEHGRKKVTCVHKANVLRISDGLFRSVFLQEMLDSGLAYDERLVDTCAAQLITHPESLDCLVTLNMYGDILSDEAAALVGGMGMAPSGNIGEGFGIFEPCHGSSPEIAGRGVANPIATVLSAAMMLDFLHMQNEAERIRAAVARCLEEGVRTVDIGGHHSTASFGRELLSRLED